MGRWSADNERTTPVASGAVLDIPGIPADRASGGEVSSLWLCNGCVVYSAGKMHFEL